MTKIIVSFIVYLIVGAAVSGIICAVDKKINHNEPDFAEIVSTAIFYPFLLIIGIIYLISSFFIWLTERVLGRIK